MKDYKIIQAMQTYGGSFARSIGDALMYADEVNYIKLTNTFTDLMEEYKKFIKPEENLETINN